jgi:hypothetical protein
MLQTKIASQDREQLAVNYLAAHADTFPRF